MTPEEAFYKAEELGKRMPKLEPVISKNARWSYRYAREVIKGKFILGEPTISKNAYYSYLYATDIIEERFILGETAISQDAYYSYCYSIEVIKGRLPDFMHNQMIISNNEFTKEYVEFIQ